MGFSLKQPFNLWIRKILHHLKLVRSVQRCILGFFLQILCSVSRKSLLASLDLGTAKSEKVEGILNGFIIIRKKVFLKSSLQRKVWWNFQIFENSKKHMWEKTRIRDIASFIVITWLEVGLQSGEPMVQGEY